jgi:hypothetical protein
MTKADHLVLRQVATDHPVWQTGLKWLINDPPVTRKIDLATGHESPQRKLLWNAAALSMKNSDSRVRPRIGPDFGKLYLPDALACIATILLENTRATGRETRREPGLEVFSRSIKVRVGPPTQFARAVEHLLDAHLENNVGVGAHPYSVRGNVPQQGVKPRSVLAPAQRVDPDEHAVHGEEARADCFLHLFGIQHGFSG